MISASRRPPASDPSKMRSPFRNPSRTGTAGRSRPSLGYSVLLCAALVLTAARNCAAKGPDKPLTFSLEELGRQAVPGRLPGATIATVHFVGEHHLLVTFPVRRLMKREPDSRPGDLDRNIEAVLVDLPSGKVAARTTWRFHDQQQYLWDLGHGRFLLRQREHLEEIAPLAHLSTEHPFSEHRLLSFEGKRILALLIGAEDDLLTVETRDPDPEEEAPNDANPDPSADKKLKRRPGPVSINFYRLEGSGTEVEAHGAGRVQSRVPLEIPMTRDGYLDVTQESKGTWLFDYIAHAGKKTELSPFDTSCFPRATFVSRSEFVAVGCRGSVDKLEIGGFGMHGEQMWQQNFFDNFVHSSFSFAPEAGRFLLAREVTSVPPSMIGPGQEPPSDTVTGQDVQVYQIHTGKALFHTVITPTQRGGQNFALSPDGLRVAVVRGDAIEVSRLPELSSNDRQEVKAARESALERADGPIRLPTQSRPVTAAEATEPTQHPSAAVAASVSSEPAPPSHAATVPTPSTLPAEAAATPPPAKPARPVEHTVNVGDVPADDGPRRPPTLYQPGDAAPR